MTEVPMTAEEASRLRALEIQFAEHQVECRGNHLAIGGRFDRLETMLRDLVKSLTEMREAATITVKDALAWQNWASVARFVIIIIVVLLAGTKHPKALFDLLDELM